MLRSVNEEYRASAELIRSMLVNAQATPAVFRAALTSVPHTERDAWLDLVFGLDALPDDGPELPRGCVPYMPCSVDALLRIVEHAGVQGSDVFVDVGSGLGRAAVLVHLLTGASAIGVEIQPALVLASREFTTRLKVSRLSVVEGDAALLTGFIVIGSVFFLYCPFSGERLKKVLAELEPIARTRQIRVCCVDLPLPPCPWLTLASPPFLDLAVYRSTLLDERR
jgi:SAM-dependent methyltransferase